MLRSRRLYVLLSMLAATILLSGCSPSAYQKPITQTGGIWDKYFVYPLSVILDWLADHLWNQYGLAILIITIVVRLIILPLTIKQVRSSKKMQELQPELKKLKEKYKDDTKKQQEETMKLFQTNKVNPLAGCFPVLVQMPVLIALYHAIIRNDAMICMNNMDHAMIDCANLSASLDFLWLHLGVADTTYILPALAALTTYIQQKMMSSQMAPQMKALLYVFPVLIFIMAMNFPSALPLYWVFTNSFTIVQNYFIYGIGKSKAEVKSKARG